jgi:hypothetical protein
MNGEVLLAVKAVSGENAIAAVDLLRMPVAIEPRLVSEPVDVANMSGTVRVAEFTS